jgi:hypothetical protein
MRARSALMAASRAMQVRPRSFGSIGLSEGK